MIWLLFAWVSFAKPVFVLSERMENNNIMSEWNFTQIMKKKKISIDINEETIKTIDDLAKLTHANRSQIITTLFASGFYPLFRQIEGSWQAMLATNQDEKMKKILRELLEGLNKIERETGIHQFYLVGGNLENIKEKEKEAKELDKFLKSKDSKKCAR